MFEESIALSSVCSVREVLHATLVRAIRESRASFLFLSPPSNAADVETQIEEKVFANRYSLLETFPIRRGEVEINSACT